MVLVLWQHERALEEEEDTATQYMQNRPLGMWSGPRSQAGLGRQAGRRAAGGQRGKQAQAQAHSLTHSLTDSRTHARTSASTQPGRQADGPVS